MQWLVDLIIDRIGGPPFFIDRGDPPAVDFTILNFTTDALWHDLDLSGIVPPEAVGVGFNFLMKTNAIASIAQFQKKGNANFINVSRPLGHFAGVFSAFDLFCPIGPDGLLEYNFTNDVWATADFVVKGWWL